MFEKKELQRICENGAEVMLYHIINQLGGFIFYMNHDMADGRIPESDWPSIDAEIKMAQEEIQFAVDHTTRFGVTQPRDTEGRATPAYWKWFSWWDNYAKSLSDEKFHQLDEALKTSGGLPTDELNKWQPEGDWQTT